METGLIGPTYAPTRSQTPDRNQPGRVNGGRRHHGARDGRGPSGRVPHPQGRGFYGGRNGRDAGRGRGGRSHYTNVPQNNVSNMLPRAPPAAPFGCLPPFLPGSASLVEQLDQRLLVVLRDGRHLVGTLRSFDQFGNMVLDDTSERRILLWKGKNGEESESTICYQTDIQLGLYILRGDVVVLMGEVEEEEEHEEVSNDGRIRFVSLDEFEQLAEEEARRREKSGEVVEETDWDFDLDLVA
ncbi:hypothetical protein ACHAWX_007212 [Stephanocyclus meneghinianus]